MHTDAKLLPNGAVLEGDLCIVGAGAAGISLAREFIGTRTRVLLLEGGGFDLEPAMQALYRGDIIGRPYYPLDAARLHYFGGTTGHWGGFCAPLDAIDFTVRPWVPHSGWPISRVDLDPYYARAHPVLELGPYEYDVSYWQSRDARRVPLALDHNVVRHKMWQFSPPTRFGSRYRDGLVAAPNVHVYTHANVCEIEANEDLSAVESLRIRHLDGREHRVRAARYVLACSTMQNVRLLLASNQRATAGLGNAHDLVGRYFMEHVEMPVGEAVLRTPQSMGLYGYTFGSTAARAELALTDDRQQALGVLNAAVAIEAVQTNVEVKGSFESFPPDEVEEFRRSTLPGVITEDATTVTSFSRRHTLFTRHEQSPQPTSRVALTRERDAMGMPRVAFDWTLAALDKHSIRTTYTTLGAAFGRANLGRVQLKDWVLADDATWPTPVSGGWHHMGGARMHTDPKHGVVNANCRVHGIANLFIAGASVFPTGGSANPTLTIVALALRLADHLKGTPAP